MEKVKEHLKTVNTVNQWLQDYMALTWQQPTIQPLPTTRIYFSNSFVTRIKWWEQPAVRFFLEAVNSSGNIDRHRWGDAPIQTAELRLLASPTGVAHINVSSVHMSTRNRIVGGEEVRFDAVGIPSGHFRRLVKHKTANATNDTTSTYVSSPASPLGTQPFAPPLFPPPHLNLSLPPLAPPPLKPPVRPPPPRGASCEVAVALAGDNSFSFSIHGIGPGSPIPADSTCLDASYSGVGPGFWLRISTSRSTRLTLSTCDSTSNLDTDLAVFSGPCDDLTRIACSGDAPKSGGCQPYHSEPTMSW